MQENPPSFDGGFFISGPQAKNEKCKPTPEFPGRKNSLPRGEGGRQVIIRSATPQIKRDNMQTFV
jgi:hypothetical protein